MEMLPRLLSTALDAALDASPIVVLTGARGTGKNTLAASRGGEHGRVRLSLGDYDLLAEARRSPDELVRRAPRLLIEEVQREVGLAAALGAAADERPEPGRFLLTATADAADMRELTETLGGRATYLRAWPLTRGEQLGLGVAGWWGDLFDTPAAEWYDLLLEVGGEPDEWWSLAKSGGFPGLALDAEAGDAWLREQVRTYLEHDLRALSHTERLADVRRVMGAACRRLGEVANQAELARETGISAPTVFRYLNLLEASYQAVRLEPYGGAGTRRLVRTPKLYWVDTAVALHLAGEESPRAAHLENLVLGDLLAWRDAQLARTGVYYWRTQLGEEVDFVVEQGGRLLAVEVRTAGEVTASDARHLTTFRRQYGDAVHGALLLHDGDDTYWVSDRVLATPWWRVI
ncbi:MAG: ATP-binding protein [Gemmatimonadetes bacterium]|nr:ATP-binding protein [Gemmatimonadota bacterium]